MASAPPPAPYQLDITIASARDLKNINWRHGPITPYAVVWVDQNFKSTTPVDDTGDTNPRWDEKLTIQLSSPIEESTLHIDIVHANAESDTKPLIGSARLKLREIVDDVGIGESTHRSLQLKRPSGRPHGKLDVKIAVRQNSYRAPDPYYAPPYGVPPPGTRSAYDYPAPPPPSAAYPTAVPPAGYPYQYNAPPQYGYGYNHPPQPTGYGYNALPQQTGYGYNAPPQSAGYGYGTAPTTTTSGYDGETKKKGSKFGVGTGIAVGAVAGVLGGLALAEGVDYVEDKIEDDVDSRVEKDLVDDGFDGGYGDDDF